MTDYDQSDIPAGYDRARDHGPEVLDLWMHTTATHLEGHSISRILNLVAEPDAFRKHGQPDSTLR
jgi:hypothetical protein